MANTLRVKRGLAGTLPNGAQGEPLFTTDTYELYIGKGDGTNQRYQKYIASGTTSQYLRGDGSLETHNLDSLTDVIVSTPSNGQVLQYNGTNWVNATSGYITGSGTAAGQVAVFSSLTNVAGYTTFTYDTVTDKLSMTNGYVNNNLTVDGQLVIKSESGASAYTRGLKFPDNSYGGTGDVAGLRLHNAGGENIILELYAGNDSLDTINFAVAAGGSVYNDNVTINGNKIWNVGNLPSPLSSTGTINSGEIAIFSNGTTVYSDTALFWDNTLNRLGVGGTSPNAQVGVSTSSGVNAFGYKTSGASYYEMVLVYDNTTYGHLFQTGRGASTSARNITFLNASSTVSIDESGNMGIGLVTPNPGTSGPGGLGLDIYGSTTAALALHNATSGTGISAGGRIYYNSTNMTIRNLSTGNMTMTVDNGNFTVITLGAENIKVEGSTGKVGIGAPASIAEMLTVNGSIQQSAVTSSMLKANASGKIIAAVSNTDFQAPITLTTTGTSGAATFNGTTLNIPQYQAVLTNPVTGSGTSGYLPKFTITGSTIGNSLVYDNGSRVMINTTSDNTVEMLQVNGGIRGTSLRVASNFSSGTAVNVLGQIYVDNRSSQGGNRIFLTPNTTSTTPYVHFYEPFTAFNTNGGISIGTSNAITTTPTDSIMHWDANNLRVGIGTSSPLAKLHVYGTETSPSLTSNTGIFTVHSTSTVQLNIGGNNSSPYPIWLQTRDTSGGSNVYPLLLNPLGGNVGIGTSSISNPISFIRVLNISGGDAGLIFSNTNGTAKNWSIGALDTGSFVFFDGAAERMRITSGGNVLIGTTSDNGDKFQVTGTGSYFKGTSTYNTLQIDNSSTSGGGGIYFRQNGTIGGGIGLSGWWLGGTSNDLFLVAESGRNIRFHTNASSTESMRITSGGNVGIGTSSPSALLNTYSATTATQIIITGADTTNQRLEVTDGTVTNRFGIFGRTNGDAGTIGTQTNHALVFNTNNAERMRITSGGNVGIGTSSPVVATNQVSVSVNGSVAGRFDVKCNDVHQGQYIATSSDVQFGTVQNIPLVFYANSTERMRITSGGDVIVNDTASNIGGKLSTKLNDNGHAFSSLKQGTFGSAALLRVDNTNSDLIRLTYSSSNTIVGQVTTNGTGVTYGSASDYRLKYDFKDYNGIDIISKIKSYDFAWKFDDTRMFGLIAHELQEILPYSVTGIKDGEITQCVDYSKLTPILVKAIQELKAEIDTLKK